MACSIQRGEVVDHILYIMTDEQSLETISALGATTHLTPAIDHLVMDGTFYSNAYTASPVCLPSRCVMMTGMMPHISGSLSNTTGASLSLEHPNLFTILGNAGFRTSLHGKCHFIPVPYPATRSDQTLEYEHFITYYKALGIEHLDLQDGKNNSLWYYDDYSKEMEGKGRLKAYRDEIHMSPGKHALSDFPFGEEDHPDAWVGRKACERIDSLARDEKAFVWVSFSGPHYPVDPPAEYMPLVDMAKDRGRVFSPDEWDDESKYHYNGFHGPGTTEGSGHADDHAQKNYSEDYWRAWRHRYFANIVLIDRWIGRILESAKRKWGDDFAVIFTSDHGEMMGNHSLWGKNGSLFEDVLRVPLVVYQPGQESRVEDALVCSDDIFPTIIKLAGADCPYDPRRRGLPLDEDVARGGRKEIVSLCDGRLAIVRPPYKLEWNRYERTGRIYKEFYDLGKDPHEFVNRYMDEEYRAIINEMEVRLEQLEKEEGLLSSVFYVKGGGALPFYVDFGEGAGYWNNHGLDAVR